MGARKKIITLSGWRKMSLCCKKLHDTVRKKNRAIIKGIQGFRDKSISLVRQTCRFESLNVNMNGSLCGFVCSLPWVLVDRAPSPESYLDTSGWRACPLITGLFVWSSFPPVHMRKCPQAVLGLNPKLPPLVKLATCMVTAAICACMCEWVNDAEECCINAGRYNIHII